MRKRARAIPMGLLALAILAAILGPWSPLWPDKASGKVVRVGPDRSPVSVKVALDQKSYSRYEPIAIAVAVTNQSDRPVNVRFLTSQRVDIVVERDGGRPVWTWSGDRMFAQVISDELLAPSDPDLQVFTWDKITSDGRQLSRGRYWVRAIYQSDPQIVSEPVVFEIR